MNPAVLKELDQLGTLGLVPYIATSRTILPSLDASVFRGREVVKLLEDPGERDFHEAYLVSNSLAFGNPDLKMANWVYTDCVLMQSAVVGFAIPVAMAPRALLSFYERDPYVNVGRLGLIPVSGQIAGLGMDGKSLVGVSLFSLRRQLPDLRLPELARLTKLAALSVYRAGEREKFLGLSQYDNRALRTHALFGEKLYIEQPAMMLHPLRDMSFIYSMKVDLESDRVLGRTGDEAGKATFLMRAADREAKQRIAEGLARGRRYRILDPVHIERVDGVYLPIAEEEAE